MSLVDAETALLEAAQARKDAMYLYEKAIITGVAVKMTNVHIAKILGVTEAAVRLYRKRHGIN